jgi:hypothetical protein
MKTGIKQPQCRPAPHQFYEAPGAEAAHISDITIIILFRADGADR